MAMKIALLFMLIGIIVSLSAWSSGATREDAETTPKSA
jgi:hypothetical protein